MHIPGRGDTTSRRAQGRRISAPLCLCVVLAGFAGCLDVSPSGGTLAGGGDPGGGGPTVSFALDVLPLFQQDCILCHGGAGGLDLDSFEGLMAGGVSGPAVLPGDAANSFLVKRLEGTVLPRMPVDAPPLTPGEIETVRQWIDEGALDN
jgi:hypothetical protein